MTESFQIYLSSNNADSTTTDGSYVFNLPMIEVPSQFHLYISLANASIPISYYNVNMYNNILVYTVLGSTYTIIIPQGNYNVNTLLAYIKTRMTNFTITYNSTLNKFGWAHPSNEFGFIKAGSTAFKLFGIDANGQSSNGQFLASANVCDLMPVKSLCIQTNLATGNINKANPQAINTLCMLPINVGANGLLTYINQTNFSTNLFTNTLSQIEIKICDQSGNHLMFNGGSWTLTIQIDVKDFVED